jgi:hypothetical protein
VADNADILLEYWKDNRLQARQTVDQRAALTNIILVIAAARGGERMDEPSSDPIVYATLVAGILLIPLVEVVRTLERHCARGPTNQV